MSNSIQFFNESTVRFSLDEDTASKILNRVMEALGKPDFSMNVISLEDEALREMKKVYFRQDIYTDIISFTIEEEPVLEGELYISPERILQNAKDYSEDPARETARILIHGACHLCGYNDNTEAEREEMSRLENMYLTQFYDT